MERAEGLYGKARGVRRWKGGIGWLRLLPGAAGDGDYLRDC